MSQKFRFSATFQPQVWQNDNAVDVGGSTEFDAHDAMLSMRASQFRFIAAEILGERGHDYDELALESGVADDWLKAGKEHTLLVYVDAEDFRNWLGSVGLSQEEALKIDEEILGELRARLGSGADLPRP